MKDAVLIGTQKVSFQYEGVVQGLPPLVLLHGFCEDMTMWEGWLQGVKGIGCIWVDLPGFGQSDLAVENSLTAFAEAVKAVLDQLAVQQCVLVGHSMGGYTALAFAEQWPDRVAGLCLFHSHPFADTEVQQQNRDRGIELLALGRKDLYVGQLFPNLFSMAFKEQHADVVERRILNGQTQSAEGITAALKSMRNRPDRSTVLRQLRCPVLFLIGKQDALIPYDRALGTTLLPKWAVVHLLDHVAHMGMFEDPDTTVRLVIAYYWQCVKSSK
jgi:pimeloyl-ACP methyl ester carboxylesterase